MGFDFTKPQHQEIIVEGNSNSRKIKFVGKFIALESEDDREEMETRIDQALHEQGEDGEKMGTKTAFRAARKSVASDIFLGWVNDPEGDPDLWVTENGKPIDCNEERRTKMINTPGLAIAIVYAFAATEFDIEGRLIKNEVRLGNSERSRGNGFRSRAAAAAPRQP